MQIKEWITKILERRNIRFPDQRPLYQYRIEDIEFELLKSAIKLSIHFGLDIASKNVPRWNAAFVMYAAEWWRREYDGTKPSWDKVFQSINASSRNLSTGYRNILIETGLQFWRRSIRTIDGRNYYLGSIACEGGLPLNQLNNSSGWLGRVFKQVIPKYSRLQNSDIQVNQLITECEFIPKTYCENKEIHLILGDMVKTVVDLKREYQLYERNNPVDYLDRHCPSWRERFPLPIETEIGRKLLSDMVSTAAKADEPMVAPLQAIRQLRGDGNLQLKIEFSGFIALEKLDMPERIPSRLDVELVCNQGSSRNLGVALKTVHQQRHGLKMPRMPDTINGDKALQGYSIRFKHLSEVLQEKPLTGGEDLDNEVPWVFAQHGQEWILEGIAGIRTRAKRIRILYPEHFSYQGDAEVLQLKTVCNGKRLLETDGCIRFTDNDANVFVIRTAQDRSSSHYYLHGKQLEFASVPKELFLGLPTLWRSDPESGAITTIPAKELVARPINSKSLWQRLTPELQGVHEIRLMDQGNIVFRKKCALLSEKFAVRFKPCANSWDATLFLDHTNPANVVCQSTLKHTITSENDGYRIDLFSDQSPPTQVNVLLHWPAMAEMLTLTLPFPARGGQIIGADGSKLSTKQALFADRLHGVRLRLFSERFERQLQIEFTLQDYEQDDIKDVYFRHEIKRNGSMIELALIDYLQWINDLFAVSRKLDSHVRLAMYENGSELMRAKISRYQFSLKRNAEQGLVELNTIDHAGLPYDVLGSIELMAMRLSQPEQEHIKLEPRVSEQTITGSWFFHPEKKVAEPWLIYSGETSSVTLRSILWVVGYDPENNEFVDTGAVSTLHSATKIGCTQPRQDAIKRILERMSTDFGHSGWDYLRHLWRHCSHLPLSSFDVWSIAVTDIRVLVALVLQLDKAFTEKLNEELPVFWELVPLKDWLTVYSAYKNYLLQSAVGEADVNAILVNRINKISTASQALDVVAKILRQSLCGIMEQDLQIKRLPIERLAEMVHEQRQELDRRQADSDWPTVLKSELIGCWQKLDQAQHFGLNLKNISDHHYSVVILPVILAVFGANGGAPEHWTNSAASIFKLNRLKTFDEEWFNAIYQWSLAYLSPL